MCLGVRHGVLAVCSACRWTTQMQSGCRIGNTSDSANLGRILCETQSHLDFRTSSNQVSARKGVRRRFQNCCRRPFRRGIELAPGHPVAHAFGNKGIIRHPHRGSFFNTKLTFSTVNVSVEKRFRLKIFIMHQARPSRCLPARMPSSPPYEVRASLAGRLTSSPSV